MTFCSAAKTTSPPRRTQQWPRSALSDTADHSADQSGYQARQYDRAGHQQPVGAVASPGFPVFLAETLLTPRSAPRRDRTGVVARGILGGAASLPGIPQRGTAAGSRATTAHSVHFPNLPRLGLIKMRVEYPARTGTNCPASNQSAKSAFYDTVDLPDHGDVRLRTHRGSRVEAMVLRQYRHGFSRQLA